MRRRRWWSPARSRGTQVIICLKEPNTRVRHTAAELLSAVGKLHVAEQDELEEADPSESAPEDRPSVAFLARRLAGGLASPAVDGLRRGSWPS